ncbi:response regulator [Cohnella sp. GCM10027633]|uniref:response regulator transcription factor n=1 Tax=unclassified Cohnella TaxID=2636738 RepID=UPI00362D79CF
MFRVMIVDDEYSVIEGLKYTIAWDKLDVDHVYTASSAYEALEQLNQHHVDIVITDIRMPGMSGLELIRRIRERWSGTRCIILSGHGEFDYAREAIRADTTDYLLKPIHEDELAETVRRAQAKLRAEWEQISEYNASVVALREHMPLLRHNLLGDLLQGRVPDREALQLKLGLLKLPFAQGDSIALLLVRLEDEFYSNGARSPHLLEYAVCNITEEIFGKRFDTWHHSDTHSYLVFVLRLREQEQGSDAAEPARPEEDKLRLVERLAAQVQTSVFTYLKGTISIMVSDWGAFPGDIRGLYETAMTSFRNRIGSSSGLFFSMGDDDRKAVKTMALDELYRLPTLLNLLDTGKWDEAVHKVDVIYQDLLGRFPTSREHLMEAYYSIASSFLHFAHKNGQQVSESMMDGVMPGNDKFRSASLLKEWAISVLGRLRASADDYTTDSRKELLAKVQSYIVDHLKEDVSLQSIADYVHFHPVYLSKIFKQETGENLRDYIHQIRMQKAVYLLKHSDLKIYEVAEQVGLDHAYFNKVFKKQFERTPQEYRES